MKNHELRAEFADCLPGSKVAIVNPATDGTDHEQYGIAKITFLMGSFPEDTIIEASREPDSFMAVLEFTTILGEQDAEGDAQVFVKNWEGQGYAYFDIASVRRGPYLHSVILGDWRCGC